MTVSTPRICDLPGRCGIAVPGLYFNLAMVDLSQHLPKQRIVALRNRFNPQFQVSRFACEQQLPGVRPQTAHAHWNR